jgi:hypothetical protein
MLYGKTAQILISYGILYSLFLLHSYDISIYLSSSFPFADGLGMRVTKNFGCEPGVISCHTYGESSIELLVMVDN